ncbi:MAG: oxaloacetate decarboxylase [Roseovarius sp.]
MSDTASPKRPAHPTACEKRQTLRRALEAGFFGAPGVFDGISARVADAENPKALYMTGYGTVASYLGLPDAGLATYTDMVGRVAMIAQATCAPLIADADTGYGGLLNVEHTVRGYEIAGASAIQLEDQEIPKKCGHTPGRRVVPSEEMQLKIRVAKDSRASDDFLIIARTDARTEHGIDEALRRAEAYVKAGADILFIEAPESEKEMETICAAGRAVVGEHGRGKTPVLSGERLAEMGMRSRFIRRRVSAAGAAMRSVYGHIVQTGTSAVLTELADFQTFGRLMGFEHVWEFDRHYAPET